VPPRPRQELIWDTHKQAHIGASWKTRYLQLRRYWPEMTQKVRQWEVCQASRHGHPTETTGRHQFYAG